MISPISGSSSNFETSRIRDTKSSQAIAQRQSIGQQRLAVPPVNRVVRRNDSVEISARGRQALQQKTAAQTQTFTEQTSQVPLTPQAQEAASPDLQAELAALTQQVAPGVSIDQGPAAGAANRSDRSTISVSVSSKRTAMSTPAQSQSNRPASNQVSTKEQEASKPSVSKQETTVAKQNSAIFERAVASYSQYSQQSTPAQTQVAALNLIA